MVDLCDEGITFFFFSYKEIVKSHQFLKKKIFREIEKVFLVALQGFVVFFILPMDRGLVKIGKADYLFDVSDG